MNLISIFTLISLMKFLDDLNNLFSLENRAWNELLFSEFPVHLFFQEVTAMFSRISSTPFRDVLNNAGLDGSC